MALRVRREKEIKIHDLFYENVYLLTLIYPPSEAFIQVFKNDMFIKSNKVGSQLAIYYLLEILDKDTLKQRIKTWPIYDTKTELQFRKDILQYICELNVVYEDANIPNITSSHLISPGGFKFIKFIFKLSQFVLYMHLQRNPSIYPDMMLPLKPSKKESITKENIDRIRIAANNINRSTCTVKEDFQKTYEEAIEESKTLLKEVCSMHNLVEDYKTELEVLKTSAEDIDDAVISNEELLKKLQILKLLKEKFQYCELLCSYLKKPLILNFNKDDEIVSDPLNRIKIQGDQLDLKNLLESFIVFLNKKYLEIKPVNADNLQMEVQRFSKLNQRLEVMLKDIKVIYKEALKVSDQLQKESVESSHLHGKFKKLLDDFSESDSELAQPLSDSA